MISVGPVGGRLGGGVVVGVVKLDPVGEGDEEALGLGVGV
jgi:hypothetical protein